MRQSININRYSKTCSFNNQSKTQTENKEEPFEEQEPSNHYESLLQEVLRIEKLKESFKNNLDYNFSEGTENIMLKEIRISIEKSKNAFDILKLISNSKEYFSLEVLAEALEKIEYLQKHLNIVKEKQLEEFKLYKKVKI